MIKLLNVDCMEYMAKCKDKEFDLAIVDPPYGIDYLISQNKLSEVIFRTSGGGKHKKYVYKEWDKSPPHASYFHKLKKISKNMIIWGGNYFNLGGTKCFLIWDKIQRDNRADCEIAWTSFNKPSKIFSYSRADAYINDCDNKIHPTQKPVKLYEWLLTNYAKPGQRILDTHLGSGSSAIAAHYFGVDFVGCEIDKDYYNSAVKRFNEQTAQIAMAI